MKMCATKQKTAYKNNKSKFKKVRVYEQIASRINLAIVLICFRCLQDLREGKIDHSKYRDEKGKVAADQQHFTQTKLKEHKDYLEAEIRKFRRQQIVHRHDLEAKLLREVCVYLLSLTLILILIKLFTVLNCNP